MKIRDLVSLPTTYRGIYLATGIVLIIFLFIGAWQTYPFFDDVTAINSAGDDWLSYKLNALSIINDGFLIPRVQGSYYEPTGFLYNYFIAVIFSLTGENTIHVYLIQAAMLALSVGIMTFAFKPYLSDKAIIIFFWTLAVILFLDVFRNYTFKLLSENLILFLLPVFYLILFRIYQSQPILASVSAGGILGLCALTRPNLILLAPVTVLLLYLKRPQLNCRTKCIALFLILFVIVFAMLPLRNYWVTGQIEIPVLTRTHHWQTPTTVSQPETSLTDFGKNALEIVIFYTRRILFCSGITFLEAPSYKPRLHWLIIWAGAIVFAWRTFRRKRKLEFWEIFTLTFVPVYLVPIIALSHIANYGFRMILPIIPIALLLAVQAVSPSLKSSKNEKAGET